MAKRPLGLVDGREGARVVCRRLYIRIYGDILNEPSKPGGDVVLRAQCPPWNQ
jgi:hypothetical protein